MKDVLTSRGFLIGLSAVVAGTIVYLLMSTKSTNVPEPKQTPENCITMTRDQIVNSWFEAGWGSPASTAFIPAIMFEPVPGDRVKVYAYPVNIVNGNCQPVAATRIEMTITDPASGTPCAFPATDTVGKLRYDFGPDDIDEFGDLIPFNFLRLKPKVMDNPDNPGKTMLSFDMELVKIQGDNEPSVARGQLKPCPPYCHHRAD